MRSPQTDLVLPAQQTRREQPVRDHALGTPQQAIRYQIRSGSSTD
jgi:hypothetical protein